MHLFRRSTTIIALCTVKWASSIAALELRMIVQKNLARSSAFKIGTNGLVAGMYRRAMNPCPRFMSLVTVSHTSLRVACEMRRGPLKSSSDNIEKASLWARNDHASCDIPHPMCEQLVERRHSTAARRNILRGAASSSTVYNDSTHSYETSWPGTAASASALSAPQNGSCRARVAVGTPGAYAHRCGGKASPLPRHVLRNSAEPVERRRHRWKPRN